MTKNKKILLGVMGAAALATAPIIAVSCGGGSKTPQVSVMMADPANPRWQKAREQAIKNIKEVGLTVAADQKDKQSDQNTWLLQQLDRGTKALLIGAQDESVSRVISEAEKKGVPVVAYDRLIKATGSTYNWYVTFDNELVGTYQGLSLLSGIYKYVEPGNGKDNVFDSVEVAKEWIKNHKLATESHFYAMAGSPSDNNARLFYDGAMNVINEAMKIDTNLVAKSKGFDVIASPNWDYVLARKTLSDSIKDYEKIIGILSPNDGMADVAVSLLKQNRPSTYKNVTITGQDSNKEAYNHIKAGEQFMTISKPDSRSTKVASIVLNVLIKNKNATKADVQEALDNAKLPFSIKIVDDNESYKTESGKFINSIIIQPKIIVKSNVEEIKQ